MEEARSVAHADVLHGRDVSVSDRARVVSCFDWTSSSEGIAPIDIVSEVKSKLHERSLEAVDRVTYDRCLKSALQVRPLVHVSLTHRTNATRGSSCFPQT